MRRFHLTAPGSSLDLCGVSRVLTVSAEDSPVPWIGGSALGVIPYSVHSRLTPGVRRVNSGSTALTLTLTLPRIQKTNEEINE